jgi:predicted DsbA family dithiol-disulfide isomerase
MKTPQAGLHCYVGAVALLLCATVSFAQPRMSVDDPPVAVIDGKPVLASELREASQGQIVNLRKQEFDIKRRALDTVVEQKLLEAEAARRGTGLDDLTQKLAGDKGPEPSDAEVEAFYLARPESAQIRLDDVRGQMRALLKAAKRTHARDDLLRTLRAQHKIDVLLESPRVEVAYDPARLHGSVDAPVRIVEFSDFECPFCRSAEKTVQAVLAKYGSKVSLAYRDFPLTSIHAKAQGAAEASRCAADQGKFWGYHDLLLTSPSLETAKLKELASQANLDQAKFNACVDSGSKRAAVESDAQQGKLAGVSGTPAFFINGIPVVGAQPAAAFEKIIEEELARKARQTTALR